MSCIWRGRTQPRAIRGRHLDDCQTNGCPGCLPCPERHCQICGKAHTTVEGHGTDQTCAECLGEVRTDLGLILTLSERLMAEAVHRGIDSEAASMAGPSIDTPAGIEALRNRQMSMLLGRIPEDPEMILRDRKTGDVLVRDEKHPLWVAGSWETIVRGHLRQEADEATRIHIWTAIDYLGEHLTRLAHDEEFPFDEMAKEIRTCRGHLEDVLHDGEQVDSGAPCLRCGVPLVREWGKLEAADGWRCPRCREWSDETQYRLAVAHLHRENATHLTDRDCEIRTGIKATTIRSWARNGHVEKRLDAGRILYSVADVLDQGRRAGIVA